jgi:hypothetical protein
MGARIWTAVIGAWLVISAFLWPHSAFQRHNAVVCGFITVGLAIAGACRRELAFLGSLMAMWLFLTAVLAEMEHTATVWNNLLASVALWGICMVEGCRVPAARGGGATSCGPAAQQRGSAGRRR